MQILFRFSRDEADRGKPLAVKGMKGSASNDSAGVRTTAKNVAGGSVSPEFSPAVTPSKRRVENY
jgi:hypothetical protein